MSSKYPILGNRPIDQWKVTELKEELKKRKLTTKGLKDDLIKRLHESIKAENASQVEEAAEQVEEEAKGQEGGVTEEVDTEQDEKETATNCQETMKNTTQESETVDENLQGKTLDLEESNHKNEEPSEDVSEPKAELPNEEQQQTVVVCDLNIAKAEEVIPMEQHKASEEVIPMEQHKASEEVAPMEEHNASEDGNINGSVTEMEDSKEAMVRDETKHSTATNQVSEVNQTLGLCDSVSADSVSIIEKNELKGNDTVELEIDVVKPEKNESVDFGDSEKLNLDRSSGDESEEDIAVDFKEVNENNDTLLANDADAMNDSKIVTDEGIMLSVSEKRKLHDDGSIADNEPPKKQPRWNSDDSVRNNAHSSPPNEAPARVFPRSDSSISEEAKKERTVPPSQKPPTNCVKIDRFLRPFTLKSVQELLAKTGTVEKFWMDSIKTHCFVSYASVDEATATREALYNLQWPPNGGRNLTVDFVDPEEVLTRVENPDKPAESVSGERQVAQRQRVSSPPPPVKEKEEAPMVTLDDLFRKTMATPRIYYLPLSEEQVKCKIADKSAAVKS